MLIKHPNGTVTSTILSEVADLVHAFTTRACGDMRENEKNRKRVLDELFGTVVTFVSAEQVHGGEVNVVTDTRNHRIADVDGLIYTHTPGERVVLGVFVADCVPILLVDPKERIVASVHAGWRGTLDGVTTRAVTAMKMRGSQPEDILVSIGPHIGMCCYDVPEDRAKKFLFLFSADSSVASVREGRWYLDLGFANLRQLQDCGILKEHIDAPPTCTACQRDEFFSYRKDSSATFGEMLGLIGYR